MVLRKCISGRLHREWNLIPSGHMQCQTKNIINDFVVIENKVSMLIQYNVGLIKAMTNQSIGPRS